MTFADLDVGDWFVFVGKQYTNTPYRKVADDAAETPSGETQPVFNQYAEVRVTMRKRGYL